ncbi:hypothetical protein [Cryobacterium sp. TMT4-31]|uniref:hypothetical protein n=1 Tax=Cryobacterium sp. TMT4-31 TaxID=1259259 RepID=UPI00106BAA37|nr:hypothetical protein [Cryobacterium sp. TMT4-31]TFC87458.1 hypothetical protein E3T19_12550 [Cryobacterium sp. TMT4-31]
MPFELVVGVRHPVAAVLDNWDEAIVAAVKQSQRDWPTRMALPGEEIVQLLVIPYLAANHAAIVENSFLSQTLGSVTGLERVLVIVVACAQSRPQVTEAQVVQLVHAQGFGIAADTTPGRAFKPSQLESLVYSQIVKAAATYEAAGRIARSESSPDQNVSNPVSWRSEDF